MHHDEKVEFMAPKGVVPEDTKPGDHFDLVSTFRLKPNGDVCLVKMGDTEMPGYDDEEGEYDKDSKVHREGYGDVMNSMHSAMSSEGGSGGMAGGGY